MTIARDDGLTPGLLDKLIPISARVVPRKLSRDGDMGSHSRVPGGLSANLTLIGRANSKLWLDISSKPT
jgi:hypothetical protein